MLNAKVGDKDLKQSCVAEIMFRNVYEIKKHQFVLVSNHCGIDKKMERMLKETSFPDVECIWALHLGNPYLIARRLDSKHRT